MARLPDLGNYTVEETQALAVDALTQLPLEKKVKAVLQAFSPDEQQELLAWLDEDDG